MSRCALASSRALDQAKPCSPTPYWSKSYEILCVLASFNICESGALPWRSSRLFDTLPAETGVVWGGVAEMRRVLRRTRRTSLAGRARCQVGYQAGGQAVTAKGPGGWVEVAGQRVPEGRVETEGTAPGWVRVRAAGAGAARRWLRRHRSQERPGSGRCTQRHRSGAGVGEFA